MPNTPELLKSLANRLAQAATSEDGLQTARLLRLTGFIGGGLYQSLRSGFNEVDEERKTISKPPKSDCVGIWERKVEDGHTCFVRQKEIIKDWNFWANVGRIAGKGKKRRVVLIGESVARGYLYDPQFTPAMVLESLLQAHLGENEIEVIDLARTNLAFEVKELARSALLLEPDAVIIFSGNNWSALFPDNMASLALVDAFLREKGMAGLKQFAEEQLRENTRQIVAELAGLYQENNIPLIWIIPEFNLADWRDPITNAPHLPKQGNREWIECCQNAWSALQQGEISTAAALARKLIELDGGTNVAGPYILAECSERLGDTDAQREYLEFAKSAIMWDSSKSISPRIHNVVSETIREVTGQYQNAVIDMPEILKEYLQGRISDRRIFLDYCHMTTEGIQIAMSAAASSVLRALTGAITPWRELVQSCIAPSPEVEAEAAFLAAVHNAHWWQPYEVVHYHCVKSVEASKHIIPIMDNFLDVQTRRAPMLMCHAAEKIAQLGSPQIQQYLLRYNSQRLDTLLLSAIIDALKQVEMDAGHRLEELREHEHGIAHNQTDLLSHYYCSAALQPQEVMWLQVGAPKSTLQRANHYYKAFWPVSRFVFVGNAGCPVALSVTCRRPDAISHEEPVSIQINGESIGEVYIGETWETWEISIESGLVKNGLNEITIHWPIPVFAGEKAIHAIVEDLLTNTLPDFFPVFGEIHAFSAKSSKAAEITVPIEDQQLSTVEVA